MTDSQIIELIRTEKSDKALIALYQHFPMMLKMIRSNGGSRQDAEDVFQEALIIFFKKVKMPEFTLTAKLSTYLFSVCRFLWNDELKKRNQYATADPETILDEAEQKDLEYLLEQEQKAKLAEKVLNELGERCRELLVLFYTMGLKLKDIASKMGYNSENTVKNQKYKCLEGAKTRLKEMKQTIQTL
jgi:RNA polymerase sigma factor (sigma-70 family)